MAKVHEVSSKTEDVSTQGATIYQAGDLIKEPSPGAGAFSWSIWYREKRWSVDKKKDLSLDGWMDRVYLCLPKEVPVGYPDESGTSFPINRWIECKNMVLFYLPPIALEIVGWFTMIPGKYGNYVAEPGTLEEYIPESSVRYRGLRHKVLVTKTTKMVEGLTKTQYRILVVDRDMTQSGMLKLLQQTDRFTSFQQWMKREDEYALEMWAHITSLANVSVADSKELFEKCAAIAHRLSPIDCDDHSDDPYDREVEEQQ